MATKRKGYPSDVSGAGWDFCVAYLTLMDERTPQRTHPLRELFNGLRWLVRAIVRLVRDRNAGPSAAILDSRTLQSTPESGSRAGFDGHKKRRGSKVPLAVDTLGHLPALHVTAANEQDRAQVGALAQAGIQLEVVKHHEAKRRFILLPRRWVVERSFAWSARFRRLARDYERLAITLAGCHWPAFAMLLLNTLFRKNA